MGKLIDADALCKGRSKDDPVVISVKAAPAVEAEPVIHGEWLRLPHWERGGMYEGDCSNCGYRGIRRVVTEEHLKYCPMCGAKMKNGGAVNDLYFGRVR